MNQCYGITNKHTRCRNKARFTQSIHGAEFCVCKIHQRANLLANWDKEIRKRTRHNIACDTGFIPNDIHNWLQNFHECWRHTNNLQVSTKFASSVFRAESVIQNFDMKFDLYINTLLEPSDSSLTCSICLDEDTEALKTNKCQHTFCIGCFKKWMSLSTTCPLCRTIL